MTCLGLDHLIFGNGFGLASPLGDARYYWLGGERHGTLYTFGPGFGAQLRNFQWTHPKPGERRMLGGRWYTVFQSRRRWFRVEVTWAVEGLPSEPAKALSMLKDLESSLGRGI